MAAPVNAGTSAGTSGDTNLRQYRTTCPYCGVGCGVKAAMQGDGTVQISGDEQHPANRGKLCLKGQSLAETLNLSGRLLHPQVDGRQASWDHALDLVASEFQRCLEVHGPDSIAFYVSGQLLTEDYYAVNKFIKGYLGTANIDTNSRLCMASSVAGHKRAFGADTVPGCYDDLEQAEVVVLVGSNLAWCHPVLHVRLSEAQENNPAMQVVTVDPRATATSALSQFHLPVRPDSDTALFGGLLKWLVEHGVTDTDFINRNTSGFDSVLADINSLDVATVARHTGLDASDITRFYELFAANERVVTVYSQGVNQSAGGTDKVNAIINCHLATGRIGTPGCGPFSVTGQPNAMGGRETGGLANMLTCHMDLDNPNHRRTVQEYWQSPRVAQQPGLKAVDLFKAIDAGQVKAVWIMATNPTVSMPDADFVKRALKRCDFVVQSDVVAENDTAHCAQVRLPAQAWGEKDGTVTNSERCISRQRRIMQPPEQTRPDWWTVSQVAARLGYADSFAYQSPAEIFAEYAELSGVDNNGSRDFDISFYAGISERVYDDLDPFYWPAAKSVSAKPIRFFAKGGFFTPDKRGRFIVTPVVDNKDHGGLANGAGKTLHLNTGRVRDQWHTMTRTGQCHSLSTHTAEPFIEIHPYDAAEARIKNADLVDVSNALGRCVLRAIVTDRVAVGSVFVPMHWCAPYANAARIDTLVPSVTDPVSGQPALKHAAVVIAKAKNLQYGFAVSRSRPVDNGCRYYATARCDGGWRTEFAIDSEAHASSFITRMLQLSNTADRIAFTGPGQYRVAAFDGQQLQAACFVDTTPVLASREWLISALSERHQHIQSRHALLAARAPAHERSAGKLVCTCFGVGEQQIIDTIVEQGCSTVADVGKSVCAGTNCGSCRGEISALLRATRSVPSPAGDPADDSCVKSVPDRPLQVA